VIYCFFKAMYQRVFICVIVVCPNRLFVGLGQGNEMQDNPINMYGCLATLSIMQLPIDK
jgi:hypothetical protein